MKNLLERLKPEVLAVINANQAAYPYLIEEVTEHLTSNYFVTYLQYRIIINLEGFYREAFGVSPEKPWDAFIEEA